MNLVHIFDYKELQNTRLIIRLAADDNYTRLYLTNALNPLLSSQPLNYFVSLLPDFIRINKLALLNSDYVDKVIDGGSRQLLLILADETVNAISRRRITETRAKLYNYQYDKDKRIWAFPLNWNHQNLTGHFLLIAFAILHLSLSLLP